LENPKTASIIAKHRLEERWKASRTSRTDQHTLSTTKMVPNSLSACNYSVTVIEIKAFLVPKGFFLFSKFDRFVVQVTVYSSMPRNSRSNAAPIIFHSPSSSALPGSSTLSTESLESSSNSDEISSPLKEKMFRLF
jgi:hypothetical protein